MAGFLHAEPGSIIGERAQTVNAKGGPRNEPSLAFSVCPA
jgi:hypothetical protein